MHEIRVTIPADAVPEAARLARDQVSLTGEWVGAVPGE